LSVKRTLSLPARRNIEYSVLTGLEEALQISSAGLNATTALYLLNNFFSDTKLNELEFQILLAFISGKKELQHFMHYEFRMGNHGMHSSDSR